MMNIRPPLNIEDYFVDEIHIRVNPDYKEPKKGRVLFSGKLEASVTIRRMEAVPIFMVSITIEINHSEKDFKTTPYYVTLKITGYFSFIEGTDEQTIEKMIPLNGPAILHGIARGIIAQATGNCMHGRFILPTVNFVEITKKPGRKGPKKKDQ